MFLPVGGAAGRWEVGDAPEFRDPVRSRRADWSVSTGGESSSGRSAEDGLLHQGAEASDFVDRRREG